MARTWTEAQKARQRLLIQSWKPWEKSTGPKTVAGKKKVSRNAYSGGLWVQLRFLSKCVTAIIKREKAEGSWPPANS